MSERFYQESNTFAEVNHVLVLVEAVGGQVIGIDVGPGVGKVFGKNTPMQIFSLPFVGIVVSFGIGGGLTLGHWKADCISQRVDQLAIG